MTYKLNVDLEVNTALYRCYLFDFLGLLEDWVCLQNRFTINTGCELVRPRVEPLTLVNRITFPLHIFFLQEVGASRLPSTSLHIIAQNRTGQRKLLFDVPQVFLHFQVAERYHVSVFFFNDLNLSIDSLLGEALALIDDPGDS